MELNIFPIFFYRTDTAMKSYEDTKDANERAPSPELSPEYPEEVGFILS